MVLSVGRLGSHESQDGGGSPRFLTLPFPDVPCSKTPPQSLAIFAKVPSRFVLEFGWRGLRSAEDTWSGSKVNRLIGEFLGQAVPSVHFAHSDLT